MLIKTYSLRPHCISCCTIYITKWYRGHTMSIHIALCTYRNPFTEILDIFREKWRQVSQNCYILQCPRKDISRHRATKSYALLQKFLILGLRGDNAFPFSKLHKFKSYVYKVNTSDHSIPQIQILLKVSLSAIILLSPAFKHKSHPTFPQDIQAYRILQWTT